MPAPSSQNNRNIKDFFKPYIVPKNRRPINNTIEDEILVAAPKPTSPSANLRSRQATASPVKRSRSSNASNNASTPTKRSPTKSRLDRLAAISQLDGANDDEKENLIHTSSPGSSQRELKAVQIPSPKPHLLPPPMQAPRPAPDRGVNTSFSSISTLSSVPLSSQASSRRIMKDGLGAVTNSDSGSADSDSDELADVETFVTRKRRKFTPPGHDAERPIEVPSTVKPGRQSTRLSDKGSSSKVSTPRLPPSPPRTVYKHSLMNMRKQQEMQEKAEARVRAAEAAYEERQKKREAELQQSGDMDSGLQAAIADDSDEGERMKLAMERTEALQAEEQFYYFRQGGSWHFPPTLGLDPGEPLYKKLLDERWRIQACLSGFVAELAATQTFPEALWRWMAGQLLTEKREDLCEAYVEILRVCAADPESGCDVLNKFDCFYTTAETRSKGLSGESQEERSRSRVQELDRPPRSLQYVLRVIQYCCLRCTEETIGDTITQLMLANIDEHVSKDPSLRSRVEDTIEQILEPVGDFPLLCRHVRSKFLENRGLSLELKCRAIAALPATSECCHQLRRHLAFHFIAGHNNENAIADPTHDQDLSSPACFDLVLSHLKKDRRFAVKESTNYTPLTSLITILDIAIDAGFSDSAFLPPSSSKPSQEEISFNAHIDALTSHLRNLSSRIRDAGTSHLMRTEAKSAFERLVLRLEHTVRTRPRPRKGVFGEEGMSGQRAFLSGFLKKSLPAEKEDEKDEEVEKVEENRDGKEDAVSVVPEEMLSDREESAESAVTGADDGSNDTEDERSCTQG